jgi:hypothetical protein
MENESKNQEDQIFSSDPEENLRIENELMKLKMQAERGALFGGNMEDLPPEIEAEFLKNVQLFEDSYAVANQLTIYEAIGKPAYKNADDLKPEQIEEELKRIMELLHSKNIMLDVLGQYDLSVIYKFITDELFQETIREIDLPGYMHNFIYEEFHPNHGIDIGRTAQEFLDHWFKKGFNEYSTEFAPQIITVDGKTFSRDEVITKLCSCLQSYLAFNNIKFKEIDTSFEWDEKEGKGMGHAEGIFSYDATIENGESIHIEGPFKLYMINDDGYWRIFYFIFPGFAWD